MIKSSGFDVEFLRKQAGEKVFARGEAYHREGQVEILATDRGRVLAQVAGTEDYRVELFGRGGKIGGNCTCPAFEDWGFCKHMVATALTANARSESLEGDDALSRIRKHLRAKDVDTLVEMVVDLAERDPALFRKLEMAAAVVSPDDVALEVRMRKALDSATRTRGFIDYRAAPHWAAGVDAALDLLADLAKAGPALALELAERAIDRVEAAVENIDDSDGHCSALLARAGDIHLQAARAARPEPVQFARQLFAREMASEYGAFDRASSLYAEVLGAEGLAEYRRLAEEAWEKLPLRAGKPPNGQIAPASYRRLQDILDVFAERAGDVDGRIALRAKDLSSPWAYLQLADFCLAQGRLEEALRWAEEGLWIFEDHPPDERLVRFAAELLSQTGRQDEARAHLWRAFEKSPRLALYLQLRKLGGEEARTRAIRFLEERLACESSARWHSPADLLVDILLHEQMFDAAWTTVRAFGASTGMKERLARASQATHPQSALAVYAERVDQLASVGGNPAYAEAVALIARMADLQGAAEQAAYVATLKERFGRKRNFMKLLAG